MIHTCALNELRHAGVVPSYNKTEYFVYLEKGMKKKNDLSMGLNNGNRFSPYYKRIILSTPSRSLNFHT